jgi:hypothetical protein
MGISRGGAREERPVRFAANLARPVARGGRRKGEDWRRQVGPSGQREGEGGGAHCWAGVGRERKTVRAGCYSNR